MGSVKEHWLDTRPTHELSFLCPKCQFPCAAFFQPPEPHEIIENEDFHEETVECLRCRSIWSAIVTADEEYDQYQGVIDGHPDTNVTLNELDWSEEDVEWDAAYEPEVRPLDIFQAGLREWWVLQDKIGDPANGAASTNRMLFTQLFALLEAYLYSEIIGIAGRDPVVQRGILKAIPSLGAQQVSLQTVAERPNLVGEIIKASLVDFSFHKLEVVDTLCQEALQQGMLPLEGDERGMIMRSVLKRHDCVHRNGMTKAGQPVDDVTLEWLMTLAKAFERMAQRVQQRVHDIDGYRLAQIHFASVPDLEQTK